MARVEVGGKGFPLPAGELVLGSDAACTLVLAGPGMLARHAVFQGQPDGQVVIRKATPAAEVLINGVRLGAEPTPLLHGDKVEVGGHELTFVDERRSGSTQYVAAVKAPGAAASRTGSATANTGGRVVSLTDGREYVIPGPSLVFGREAGCDVVVAGKDVSRRHAEIVQTPKGYLLVDSSTNGTFVNEEQVQGQRLLARADVIRLGEEQFRFYADVAAPASSPPSPLPPQGTAASAPPAAPAPPSARPGTPAVPPAAGDRLRHTVHGLEAATPSRVSQGGALANFLVRSGALKGQRLQVKTPVANIGRAEYNDLVIPDPSVSTTHGKLQRREGIWVLVDLESTNGSFVDGERIKGDAPLAPGALVRLGDVQLVFEPTDDAVGVVKGGGTQILRTPHSIAPTPAAAASAAPAALAAPPARPAPAASTAAPPRPRPAAAKPAASKPAAPPSSKRPAAQQPPAKQGKGCGGSAAVLLLAGAGVVALLHRLLA